MSAAPGPLHPTRADDPVLVAAIGGRGAFTHISHERTNGIDLTKSFCEADGPDAYEQSTINLWADTAKGASRGQTRGGGVLGRSTFTSSVVPRFVAFGSTTNEGANWRTRNLSTASLRESFRYFDSDSPKFNNAGGHGGMTHAPRRGVFSGVR